MTDLTDLADPMAVRTGDEVVLFGRQQWQGEESQIDVDEVAGLLDTISYEVTCLIGKRVPRAYLRDGQCEHISNNLI